MEYRLLGPLSVVDGDREVSIGPRQQRILLTCLAVHVGTVVSPGGLIDVLWGERPPSSATNLVQVYVSRLRKTLGRDAIATRPEGYLLAAEPERVDTELFTQLVDRGRFRQALDLWRGPALGEWADEPWARPIVAHLDEQRLTAIEKRVEADLAVGQSTELTGELEALLIEHPLRERFWAQLMTALYRGGRQADALAAYTRARTALVDGLGIEPGPELQALQQAVLSQDPSLATATKAPASNLPARQQDLIGREGDVARVADLLDRHSVVTIVGPGGVGKTAVALAAATQCAAQHPDGAFLIELGPIPPTASVAAAVAGVMGVHEEPGVPMPDTLADYLSDQRVLVVLDNCEHVLDQVAALVYQTVRRAPGLHILVTSREALAIPGEAVCHLAGLATDDGVRLFVQRAETVRPGVLTSDTEPVIARICDRLDGLPLAIELAAARVRSLAPAQIEAGLDDRFGLLAARRRVLEPRHQSLAAMIDWSYRLLEPDERRLLDCLSVFAGSFGTDAARAVASENPDPVDGLDALVARCLVVREPDYDGQARFRLLETIREYASQHADNDEPARHHVEFHLELAERAEAGLRTADSPAWMAQLRHAEADLRLAVERALAAGSGSLAHTAARLAAALYWPWFLRGQLSELRGWLAAGLRVASANDHLLRARLLWGLAGTAAPLGNLDETRQLATQQLTEAEFAGSEELAGYALTLQANAAWASGDHASATTLFRDGVDRVRRANSAWGLALCAAMASRGFADAGQPEPADHLAEEALAAATSLSEPMVLALSLDATAAPLIAAGRLVDAEPLCQRSLNSYRTVGYEEGIASALANIARIAHHRAALDDGRHAYQEALDICRRLRHQGGIATSLEGLADIARMTSQAREAVRLLAAAAAIRDAHGIPVPVTQHAAHAHILADLRRTLGPDAFTRNWATGQSSQQMAPQPSETDKTTKGPPAKPA